MAVDFQIAQDARLFVAMQDDVGDDLIDSQHKAIGVFLVEPYLRCGRLDKRPHLVERVQFAWQYLRVSHAHLDRFMSAKARRPARRALTGSRSR